MSVTTKVARYMSAAERKALIGRILKMDEAKGRRIRNANFCGARAIGLSNMSDEESADFAEKMNLDRVGIVEPYTVFAHKERAKA
jgi:hypothetical protein